jgi:hypothetical protein
MTEKFLPNDVIRYLDNYASDKWSIEWIPDSHIACCVVIPAIMEFENIKKLLQSLIENERSYFEKILIAFVINNVASASNEVKEDNKKSITYLRTLINSNVTDDFSNEVIGSGIRIGLVDASSESKEMPEKEGGVGFARKTGMDLCLKIFNYNSDLISLLVCLDSDCTVDNQYLAGIHQNLKNKNLKAGYINFKHQLSGTDEDKFAIVCYEIFLRYYVLGLQYADSPYAFHTIGSTLFCTYDSYIKVEGMNKRKAAEDFYFMEKLAKNFPIIKIDGATVYPSGRPSWRVPFGTGQRITRFLSKNQNEYLLYDPASFRILKSWLKEFGCSEIKTPDKYLSAAKEINLSLYEFLKEQKFEENWKRILLNSKTEEQINKQKSFWFDGFRTLKLIHYLRDNGFPELNMFHALDLLLGELNQQTPKAGTTIPTLPIQFEYLEILRKLT